MMRSLDVKEPVPKLSILTSFPFRGFNLGMRIVVVEMYKRIGKGRNETIMKYVAPYN